MPQILFSPKPVKLVANGRQWLVCPPNPSKQNTKRCEETGVDKGNQYLFPLLYLETLCLVSVCLQQNKKHRSNTESKSDNTQAIRHCVSSFPQIRNLRYNRAELSEPTAVFLVIRGFTCLLEFINLFIRYLETKQIFQQKNVKQIEQKN